MTHYRLSLLIYWFTDNTWVQLQWIMNRFFFFPNQNHLRPSKTILSYHMSILCGSKEAQICQSYKWYMYYSCLSFLPYGCIMIVTRQTLNTFIPWTDVIWIKISSQILYSSLWMDPEQYFIGPLSLLHSQSSRISNVIFFNHTFFIFLNNHMI